LFIEDSLFNTFTESYGVAPKLAKWPVFINKRSIETGPARWLPLSLYIRVTGRAKSD